MLQSRQDWGHKTEWLANVQAVATPCLAPERCRITCIFIISTTGKDEAPALQYQSAQP